MSTISGPVGVLSPVNWYHFGFSFHWSRCEALSGSGFICILDMETPAGGRIGTESLEDGKIGWKFVKAEIDPSSKPPLTFSVFSSNPMKEAKVLML